MSHFNVLPTTTAIIALIAVLLTIALAVLGILFNRKDSHELRQEMNAIRTEMNEVRDEIAIVRKDVIANRERLAVVETKLGLRNHNEGTHHSAPST